MEQVATPSAARWPAKERRLAVQQELSVRLAEAIDALQSGPVDPRPDPDALRARLKQFDFREPLDLLDASGSVIDLLQHGIVHLMHPAYFGLYNPSVTFPSILADQITAHFNPCLAVWSQAPAAVEIERHVVEAVGGLAGWRPDEIAGHFTSGGAEANNTAVLMALTAACPAFSERGARAFAGRPRLYVSAESHLAWFKIAHQAGIGREAVRLVPTDGTGKLDPQALEQQIRTDRAAGDVPVFIGATAGTTNAGMIDPLDECFAISRAHGAWFHVDAAWGGAGLVSPHCAEHLSGIEKADSITLDAHKWFAVPMGAGMFLCRDRDLLGKTFRVAASYMPAKHGGRCRSLYPFPPMVAAVHGPETLPLAGLHGLVGIPGAYRTVAAAGGSVEGASRREWLARRERQPARGRLFRRRPGAGRAGDHG